VAGWIAADANRGFVDRATLGIEETPDAYITPEGSISKDEVTGPDIPKIISPGVKHLLDERGFDYEALEDLSFEEAQERVKYFLLVSRLEDQLQANTEGWLETTVGVAGTFGTEVLTDPLNIASIGYASLAKNASKKILMNASQRLSTKAGAANGLTKVEKFVLSASERLDANKTVSGAILNNNWTRNHGALMLGLEAGTLNTAADLMLQNQTDDILDKYLEYDEGWWSFQQSATSGLLGLGLGYGLGKFFLPGADQLTKRDAAAARLLSPEDRAALDGRPTLFEDRRIALDAEDVSDDAVFTIIEGHLSTFTTSQRNLLNRMLSESTDYDLKELAKFMLQKPTLKEIQNFIGYVDQQELFAASVRVTQLEADYKNLATKRAAEGKPLSNIEKHNWEAKIQKAKDEQAKIAFPTAPKDTTLKRLAQQTADLRERVIKLTNENANVEKINEVIKEWKKIDKQLQEVQTSISGAFRSDDQVELLEFIDSFDRPRTDRLDPGRQADLMRILFQTGDFDFPLHNGTVASKVLNNRVFSSIASLGTRRHDVEQLASKSRMASLLANMIHPLAHTNSSMVGGESVTSLSHLYSRIRARMETYIAGPTEALHRRAGGNKAQLDRDYIDAMRVAAGIDSTDDELVAELANAYRKFYDEMGQYGARTSTFGGLLEDFVHITLNPEAANKHGKMLRTKLGERYKKTYMANDNDTPLHIGAMMRAEIVDADGKYNADFGDIGRLKKLEDLIELKFADGTSAFDRYLDLLESTLEEHAAAAIHNKVNSLGGKVLTAQAKSRGDSSQAWRAVRSDLQRKIEQEFFLDRDIMEAGVVELNPIMNGLSYNFGSGVRIARQDAVNRVTGRTDLTWEGLVELTRREVFSLSQETQAGRKAAESLIETLMDAERDVSGRNISLGEGELSNHLLATNVRNVGGAFVNPGIGVAMSSVEIPAAIVELSSKFGIKNTTRAAIKILRDGNFSREQLRSIGKGLDFIVREHRHMASTGFSDESIVFGMAERFAAPFKHFVSVAKGDRAPRTLRGSSNKAANIVTAGTEALADYARMGSFEEFLTNRSRAAIAYIHLNQAMEYLPKLAKLAEKTTTFGDLKGFKRAARESGFGGKWALAQEFTDAGLTGSDTLAGLNLLKANGVDNVADGQQVSAAIYKIKDGNQRELATEAYNKLLDYARQSVDNFIVNPSVWDRPSHGPNPMIQLLNTFLSYPRGFRNNRLRPIADRGATSLLFWSGFFLIAETVNRNLQSMIFKGEKPSDLLEAWEEDPSEMTLRSVSAVPFLGPYQDGVFRMIHKAFGGDSRVRLGGSPGLGITGQLVNDVLDISQAVLSPDEELDKEALYRLEKAFPILNWVLPRAIQSMVESAIEE